MSRVFCVLYVLMFACSPSESIKDLPVVNLDAANTQDLDLSTLVDEVRIIPLETHEKFLISNPQVCFTHDFILVGSFQRGPGREPGRLFRFDYNGKFINEIGAGSGGKGPGEHIGEPSGIRYYEDDQHIQVNWGGRGLDPQLFNLSGDFVQDVQIPKILDNNATGGMDYVERWDDSIWFASSFGLPGPPYVPGDSSLINFFSSDGQVVKVIRRTIFSSQESALGLPPSPVRYKKGDSWKFFVTGLDTLFRIEEFGLVPEVVFRSKSFVNYMTITKTEEFYEKQLILSMAEGENYWLLFRQILMPNFGANWDAPIVFIDKHSLQAINIRLIDDIFKMFPQTFFGENWNTRNGRKPFEDNQMYMVINADELVELLKDREGEGSPKMQLELEKLKNLKEDENPVIILFTLKDTIEVFE